MNLHQKLLDIQKSVDRFVKDNVVGEGKSAYRAVGSEQVLETLRPLLNDHGLLLIPSVQSANVMVGATSSGTARYLTELTMIMTWVDVESGETLAVPWYAQGVDLAGEKGVGKANTYAEKYFFMKFFHVPTPKDDPDTDTRTKSGELTQRGTAAAGETAAYCRKAVLQALLELCDGDMDKVAQSILALTKSESRGYAGVQRVEDLTDAAAKVLYGKVKALYAKKMGREFNFQSQEDEIHESNV